MQQPINQQRFNSLSDLDKAKFFKCLSYRQREIMKLRFGLGDGYQYTLKEIGRIFNCSSERIRQLERKALAKMDKVYPTEGAGCTDTK